MAKGKTKQSSSNGSSLLNINKIYGYIRKAGLVAPAVAIGLENRGNPIQALDGIISAYTGYSFGKRNFDWRRLPKGWGGYLGATLMTRVVPKLVRAVEKIF